MDISDDQIREAFDAAIKALLDRGWTGEFKGIYTDDDHPLFDFDIHRPFITVIVYVDDENPLRTRVLSEAKRRHRGAQGVIQGGRRITFRP